MSYWDERFSAPGFLYGSAPNAFLREQAPRLARGSTVLVPGDGEGRNGVWLAEQVFQVTTVDGSAVGLAKARALADERGVSIETIHADLTEWAPAEASVEALVLVYVHFPQEVRAAIHRALLHGLRIGGLLILEAFHPNQLGRASGGPKDLAMLYTLDLLRADLASVDDAAFEELLAWEGETRLDEGPGHLGEARITRLVARRIETAT